MSPILENLIGTNLENLRSLCGGICCLEDLRSLELNLRMNNFGESNENLIVLSDCLENLGKLELLRLDLGENCFDFDGKTVEIFE